MIEYICYFRCLRSHKACVLKFLLIGAVFVVVSGVMRETAWANDRTFPGIKAHMDFETAADSTFRSDNHDAEVSDVYSTVNLGIDIHANRFLSLYGGFVMEPVVDIGPHSHRFFEDHGLYAEELGIHLDLDKLHILAGKFNPTFGIAWDRTPSVYGADFAEDYQLTEQIGLAGKVSIGQSPLGHMSVSVASFFEDTTALNRSAFTSRGHKTLLDGGAGNTEKLNNFLATLEGESFLGLKSINYHLCYRFRSKGKTAELPNDERGVVAGLYGEQKLGESVIDWVGEFTAIKNVGGSSDNEYWLTIGAGLQQGAYHFAASYTGRKKDGSIGHNPNDILLSLSAGRELDRGWHGDLGYKYERLSGTNNHTIGLRFSKSMEYNSAQ